MRAIVYGQKRMNEGMTSITMAARMVMVMVMVYGDGGHPGSCDSDPREKDYANCSQCKHIVASAKTGKY